MVQQMECPDTGWSGSKMVASEGTAKEERMFPAEGSSYLSDVSVKPGLRRHSLTPGRAVRQHCIDCAGSPSAVKDCQGDKLYDGPCLFFRYRMGKGRPSVKLIRKYCLQCMGGSPKLVKDCTSESTCPLHPYRMGRNPKKTARDRAFFHQDRRKSGRE